MVKRRGTERTTCHLRGTTLFNGAKDSKTVRPPSVFHKISEKSQTFDYPRPSSMDLYYNDGNLIEMSMLEKMTSTDTTRLSYSVYVNRLLVIKTLPFKDD